MRICKDLESRGCQLPPIKPKASHFDSNCITPDTEFMARLTICLQYYIHDRMNNNPAWQNISVRSREFATIVVWPARSLSGPLSRLYYLPLQQLLISSISSTNMFRLPCLVVEQFTKRLNSPTCISYHWSKNLSHLLSYVNYYILLPPSPGDSIRRQHPR
jgi:hypothetical protein